MALESPLLLLFLLALLLRTRSHGIGSFGVRSAVFRDTRRVDLALQRALQPLLQLGPPASHPLTTPLEHLPELLHLHVRRVHVDVLVVDGRFERASSHGRRNGRQQLRELALELGLVRMELAKRAAEALDARRRRVEAPAARANADAAARAVLNPKPRRVVAKLAIATAERVRPDHVFSDVERRDLCEVGTRDLHHLRFQFCRIGRPDLPLLLLSEHRARSAELVRAPEAAVAEFALVAVLLRHLYGGLERSEVPRLNRCDELVRGLGALALALAALGRLVRLCVAVVAVLRAVRRARAHCRRDSGEEVGHRLLCYAVAVGAVAVGGGVAVRVGVGVAVGAAVAVARGGAVDTRILELE
mmetsp:Transcript_41099/g.90209  ORF Transcript_41099/g.90209 Transcript_41099/m.90209 type:complete len:359 (+) Transcript_41099:474-1550(+)